MKTLRYLIEAGVLWASFLIFRLLPATKASDLGGWIGRTVGPWLAASRKAVTNLQNAFPDMPYEEAKKITVDMWDNLGRVIAEYPHLQDIILNHTEVVNEEFVQKIGKDNPCVIIGGHIANWELLPFYFNYKIDWPITGIYRAPNNPYAERLLDKCRNPEKRGTYVPKSQQGARDLVKSIRKGDRIGVLIDQKYNQGIPVEFFGRPAMTSPSFAHLAEKYDCPVLPFQVERLKGCKFRVTLHQPFRTEGRPADQIVLQAHTLLEDWIAKKPEQWLWLHRRWDSRALQ